MNGQKPPEKTWEELIKELKVVIHNAEINLTLLYAQLHEAEKHSDQNAK